VGGWFAKVAVIMGLKWLRGSVTIENGETIPPNGRVLGKTAVKSLELSLHLGFEFL
jgi:hypothetical protein